MSYSEGVRILSAVPVWERVGLLLSAPPLTLQEAKAMARDAHPKILAGMFFFFALGATGGLTSLVTQGKSIFER